MTTGIPPSASPRQLDADDPYSWYVFWDNGLAYGSRGNGMTEETATALADKISRGTVTP